MASANQGHHEEDISIINRSSDTNDDGYEDEADLIFQNFQLRNTPRDNSESVPVFYQAYDELKSRYNELYAKSVGQANKIKELENSNLNSGMDSNESDSFLFVSSEGSGSKNVRDNSDTEIGALRGQVTNLQRKLMVAEFDVKTLTEQKFQLEKSLKSVRQIAENGQSQERDTSEYLQRKIDDYKERVRQLESIKGSDLQQEIINMRNECKKLKEENNKLTNELKHCKSENILLKQKLTGTTESSPAGNLALSNGTVASFGTSTYPPNGLTRGMTTDFDQLSMLSLNSSLPATDELRKLKQYIKSLKTTIERQHGALKKLEENPAIRKVLQESTSMSVESRRRASNSSCNGVIELSDSNPNLSNGVNLRNSGGTGSEESVQSALNPRPMSSCLPASQKLQVNLPEVYDNVPQTKTPGHFPFKSQSEVIYRQQSHQRDLQRSRSVADRQFTLESAAVPVFEKESTGFNQVDRNRYGDHRASGSSVDPGRVNSPFRSDALFQPSPYQPPSPYQASPYQQPAPYQPEVAGQICPVCSENFTRRSVSDFQTHVFNCVDADEQPSTLTTESGPDRVCPMCNERFPPAVAQIMVDNHVNAHFGEAPIGDGFEILNTGN